MFKYDFGELGVRPMRVNHKLSPSQGWDGEPCLGGGGIGGETCLDLE